MLSSRDQSSPSDRTILKLLRRMNRLSRQLNRLPGQRAQDLLVLSSGIVSDIARARQVQEMSGKIAAYRAALAQCRQARRLLSQSGMKFFLSTVFQNQLRQDMQILIGLLSGLLRIFAHPERAAAISLCIPAEADIISQRRQRGQKLPCRTKKRDRQK